jgi:hypothetical protein
MKALASYSAVPLSRGGKIGLVPLKELNCRKIPLKVCSAEY